MMVSLYLLPPAFNLSSMLRCNHHQFYGIHMGALAESKVDEGELDPFEPRRLAPLRSDMLRFARLQLRDESVAEDVVQEALASAYSSKSRFSGRSQFKTWVFAILRNKVVDLIRSRSRGKTESLTDSDGSDREVEELFNREGFWHKESRPAAWPQPDQALDNDQFWQVFELCMQVMSESTARVFTMRELLDLNTAEICAELGISESNCWVILHRARSRLRLCLSESWFNQDK